MTTTVKMPLRSLMRRLSVEPRMKTASLSVRRRWKTTLVVGNSQSQRKEIDQVSNVR